MDPQATAQIRRSCTRFLSGHGRPRPQQMLADLAAFVDPDLDGDTYGQGAIINDFEQEIARILGKEAAVFMPSGTMCQQIALRLWAEHTGRHHVAFHPQCHLEIHEQFGYRELHHLPAVLVGDRNRLLTLADLQSVAEPLGALLLELPQREIGGQLPAWDDLVAITEWAREHDTALHMDGARLWQCNSFYGRDYAAIAALFDSVYVSFYKDLGGIAGAALAGPAAFIAEARVWQRRHGGNLVQLYPYVVAAQMGLRARLARMPDYYAKAQEIAAALTDLPEITLVPDPPQTNMLHIFLRGDRERLIAAALDLAQATGTWTFGALATTPLPDQHQLELTVGDATLALPTEEIAAIFRQIFERAGAQ
jgi:threonine aldolase